MVPSVLLPPRCDDVAEHPARESTDDQAGRAVGLLAIIAAVAVAIDAVALAEIIAAVIVVAMGAVARIAGAVAIAIIAACGERQCDEGAKTGQDAGSCGPVGHDVSPLRISGRDNEAASRCVPCRAEKRRGA